MIRNLIRCAALAAVVGLGACDVATPNEVSGDTQKVLGTPDDAEALISTYYRRWSTGVYGNIADLEGMTSVMSMMNYSSLANNCQNSHLPFANIANGNAPGNVCLNEQYRLYSILGEVDRVASNLLTQMDGGLVLGLTTPATDARNLRARSFAEFLRGISLGYIALMHDSAAVIAPAMTGQDAGVLVPYTQVMDSAYAALQRAIDYAVPAAPITGANGFPLPVGWLPTPSALTAAQFVQVIRSYRARFRANVARTPADRAAVDWASVVADAQNGITADHLILTSTTSGPNDAWRQQYDQFTTWHQMPPFIIGMADVSGSYATWIAQALSDRGAGNNGFTMATPDLRFPQGATRALQNADFAITACQTAATPCKRYFVNRDPGADQFSGAGWGWSNYDFVRYHSWVQKGDGTARNGLTPFFTIAELNMLQAEGLYRQGNYAGAGALVNKTRTAGMVAGVATGGGLPAIAVFDGCANTQSQCGTPVPGGANCVPKAPGFGVPAADFTKVGCGNLWEALKYEKRIETAYTHYAPWYLDMRGWGDLAKDTPLYWAVPYQDLQARGRPSSAIYCSGPTPCTAASSTAGASTYGW
jgi:hypothetical protein